MSSGSFKDVIYKMCLEVKWPAMVDIPWNQTKPKQTKPITKFLSKWFDSTLTDPKRVDIP